MRLLTQEQLYQLYIVEKKTTRELAEILECSQPWAIKYLRKNNVEVRKATDREPPIAKGTKFTKEHKSKISLGRLEWSKNSSIEEKARPEKKTGQIVNCSFCKKEIYKQNCHLEYELHFCNKRCHGDWRSLNQTGENHPKHTKFKTNCSNCNRGIVRKNCEKERSKYFFCCVKCNGEWKSKNLVGDKIYNYIGGVDNRYYGPNWIQQRKQVRIRDNYTCQKCGITKEEKGKNPDVHHIIPFRNFGVEKYIEANNLNNLICYCNKCHKLIEELNNKIK